MGQPWFQTTSPFAVTIEYEAGRFGGLLYLFAWIVIALFGVLHATVIAGSFVAYVS